MDYQQFYRQLFAPLESQIGSIDANTIFAIIGFGCGGPLNFCTIGSDQDRSKVKPDQGTETSVARLSDRAASRAINA